MNCKRTLDPRKPTKVQKQKIRFAEPIRKNLRDKKFTSPKSLSQEAVKPKSKKLKKQTNNLEVSRIK